MLVDGNTSSLPTQCYSLCIQTSAKYRHTYNTQQRNNFHCFYLKRSMVLQAIVTPITDFVYVSNYPEQPHTNNFVSIKKKRGNDRRSKQVGVVNTAASEAL